MGYKMDCFYKKLNQMKILNELNDLKQKGILSFKSNQLELITFNYAELEFENLKCYKNLKILLHYNNETLDLIFYNNDLVYLNKFLNQFGKPDLFEVMVETIKNDLILNCLSKIEETLTFKITNKSDLSYLGNCFILKNFEIEK